MESAKQYEYLFLGGGKGGKSLAMDLARSGKRVAIIERGMIGGSCINVACIPSKTLIQNARNMHAWRAASADAHPLRTCRACMRTYAPSSTAWWISTVALSSSRASIS